MQIEKGIHLFHGDCLEVLKKLPSNSVDLILADPPYEKMKYATSWDSIIDLNQMWEEL
jgi:DNA modification methylase